LAQVQEKRKNQNGMAQAKTRAGVLARRKLDNSGLVREQWLSVSPPNVKTLSAVSVNRSHAGYTRL
jgi:hypothetical protein